MVAFLNRNQQNFVMLIAVLVLLIYTKVLSMFKIIKIEIYCILLGCLFAFSLTLIIKKNIEIYRFAKLLNQPTIMLKHLSHF